MQVFGPQSLNRRITFAAIKEWIGILQLTEADTIRLHPRSFDDLAMEYRAMYDHAMPEPYLISGVLLEEAQVYELTRDQIIVFLDDDRPRRFAESAAPPSLADDDRPIYRCGFCGGIVDSNGREVDSGTRALHIKILQSRGHVGVKALHGRCCPNGNK